MKINIILFSLLISSLTIYGQSFDTIRLTSDTGLFSGRIRGSFIHSNGVFLIDSMNYEFCGIWKFDLDQLQNRFNKLTQNKDYDTTLHNSFKKKELIKNGLNNSIYVFSGISKAGEYILIPDINTDKNFLNDPVYRYSQKKIPQENLQLTISKLPIIKIGIETWNVDHLQTREMSLRFIPKAYFGNLNVRLKDSLANQLISLVECVDYVKGDIKLNGKEYILYLKNEFPNARFTNPEEISISFQNKNSVETKKNNIIYYAVDTIPLDGYLYKIGNIDPYGEWVTFNRISAENDGISVGKYAKNIHGANLLNGTEISLTKLLGNYILLDFWGTWCVPCMEGVPKLKELYNKYKLKNFKLIGIAQDKNAEIVKKHLSKLQMKWPNILQSLNAEQPIISNYKVTNFPTYIIISPNGRIVYRGHGIQALNEVDQLLDKIF